MHQEISVKPLGAVLQQASLVSAAQVNLALEEQLSASQCRLGKLLSNHGWIKEKTARFFAEEWPNLYLNPVPLPLGHYFLYAHLLTESQIDNILEQQSDTSLRFGVLAVANGWVKLNTLNFFLKHLHLVHHPQSPQLQAEQTDSIDIAEHWDYLRECLLENELANPHSLLKLYQQILTQNEVTFTGNLEQTTLLNIGLVVLNQYKLVIAHPLYKSVFNQDWINRELNAIHPYDKIRLQFLNLSKAGQYPYRILEAILAWTNGHILLNQKIAHIIHSNSYIQAGEESVVVEQLVNRHIISDWQTGFAAQHFHVMEAQLLNNETCGPLDLLTYYQEVWQQHQVVASASPEEIELIRLGFLHKEKQQVKVANLIYRSVFDHLWLDAKVLELLEERPSQHYATPELNIQISHPNHSTQATYQLQASASNRQLWLILSTTLLVFFGIVTTVWLMARNSQYKNGTIDRQETDISDPQNPKSEIHQTSQKNIKEQQESDVSTQQDPQLKVSQSSQKNFKEQEKSDDIPVGSTSLPKNHPPTQKSDKDLKSTSSGNTVLVKPQAKLPIFVVGTQKQKILMRLGPPDVARSGYWPNSFSILYKNIYRHHTDVGYLFDVTTKKLRQTEVAFAQTAGLETMKKTIDGLLKGNTPLEVEKQLALIFQRQVQTYEFRVKDLKGTIQRNSKDRIYIGIWESDFH